MSLKYSNKSYQPATAGFFIILTMYKYINNVRIRFLAKSYKKQPEYILSDKNEKLHSKSAFPCANALAHAAALTAAAGSLRDGAGRGRGHPRANALLRWEGLPASRQMESELLLPHPLNFGKPSQQQKGFFFFSRQTTQNCK